MSKTSMSVLLALSVSLLPLPTASGQTPLRFSVSGGGFSTNLSAEDAGVEQQLSGYSAGGDASIAIGRIGLGVRYLEGSLTPNGAGTGRDIVEGEAMLSIRTFSWLSVKLGPHIRSFIKPDGTERWFFWEGRLQARTPLGTPRLTSILEVWQVLSADVDANESFDAGQGMEGFLRWEISASPIWLGLGYRIDRSRLGGGSKTEVLEHVLISIGFGRVIPN